MGRHHRLSRNTVPHSEIMEIAHEIICSATVTSASRCVTLREIPSSCPRTSRYRSTRRPQPCGTKQGENMFSSDAPVHWGCDFLRCFLRCFPTVVLVETSVLGARSTRSWFPDFPQPTPNLGLHMTSSSNSRCPRSIGHPPS